MKKFVCSLLVVCLILALCACGAKKSAPEDMICGGFSAAEDSTITPELQEIFNAGAAGTEAEGYTLLSLVATQVVAGLNYQFLCETPDGMQKNVIIYRDLSQSCSLLRIEDVG